MTETRTLIGEEKGWRIIAVSHTTYEAKKDGESVVLAAGMMTDLLELIEMREKGASDEEDTHTV